MSHPEQREFCRSIQIKFPERFNKVKALDCGLLDISGSNKVYFTDSDYTGIDVGPGKNVDVVTEIGDYDAPDKSFDTIISTECFEHDMFLESSILNIIRMLKSNGLFVFTCATIGRPEHGTTKAWPEYSPLTLKIDGWENYYKNLTENDFKSIINFDEIFSEYQFQINKTTCDLYFYGIKK